MTRPVDHRFPANVLLPPVPESVRDPEVRSYLDLLRSQLSRAFDAARIVSTDTQSPPVLHVARTTNQALTAATPAKVQFNSSRYDTHGYWDATNYRYLPQVAGYYRISWSVKFEEEASGCNICTAALYLNGTADKSVDVVNQTLTAGVVATQTTTVYADGSTRYFEIWAAVTATTDIVGDAAYTYLAIEYVGDNYPGVVTGTDAATGLGAGGTATCTGGGVSGCMQAEEFTTPGAFSATVPTGVEWVFVTMIGAGGGGAGRAAASTTGGGGGGSGEIVVSMPYAVTAGGTVTGTVGAGGAGGAAGNNAGADGGTTSFELLSVLGGFGANQVASTHQKGGDGGGPRGGLGGASGSNPNQAIGTAESPVHFGGSGGGGGGNAGTAGGSGAGAGGITTGGAGGAVATAHAGGGGGAASIYGIGGDGGDGDAPGDSAPAASYGAGGGGAGANTSNAGGDGADGYVLVHWFGTAA